MLKKSLTKNLFFCVAFMFARFFSGSFNTIQTCNQATVAQESLQSVFHCKGAYHLPFSTTFCLYLQAFFLDEDSTRIYLLCDIITVILILLLSLLTKHFLEVSHSILGVSHISLDSAYSHFALNIIEYCDLNLPCT